MSVAVPLHEIIAELEELDDRNDRLEYLIEIGKTLPPLPEHLRTEENRVLGCQARVWLTASQRPGRIAGLDIFLSGIWQQGSQGGKNKEQCESGGPGIDEFAATPRCGGGVRRG